MFRFAELLIVILMLYLIVNILRYTIVKLGALDRLGGSWLFGLSSGWLETTEKKKQDETKEEKQSGKGEER